MVDGACTGAAADIMEGRKSFPSGHTALSYAGAGGSRQCGRRAWRDIDMHMHMDVQMDVQMHLDIHIHIHVHVHVDVQHDMHMHMYMHVCM